MHLAIDKAIPGNATKIYSDFKGTKYRELFTRLVLKVIIKNKWTIEYIEEYGGVVLTGQGKMTSNLVDELRQIIKSSDTPILQRVSEIYRTYDDVAEKYVWQKQDSQEFQTVITNKLRLNNIDIFERLINDI